MKKASNNIAVLVIILLWIAIIGMLYGENVSEAKAYSEDIEVSVEDVLQKELDILGCSRQLELIPNSILKAFVDDGWKFGIDINHTAVLSTGKNTNWQGVTDYEVKTIWIRYPDVVVHEFGHFLWYLVDDRLTAEVLYALEAENMIETLGDYAVVNSHEYFAECFEYWILNQNDTEAMREFQEAAPKTYKYFAQLANNDWTN